jgi:hypothetical protein
MLIEELETTGLRGLAGTIALDRLARLALPWEARRALRHALHVPFALVDRPVALSLAEAWGATGVEVIGEPWVTELRTSGVPGLLALLDDRSEGLVRVRVRVRLDPPQYAVLRHHAVRDPRLVDALAGGPTCELTVGLRFAPAAEVVAVDPLAFAIGRAPFALAGPDRPAWLGPFLSGFAGRFAAAPLAPSRWAEAAARWDGPTQLRLRAALAAACGCPDPVPGLVPLHPEPGLLGGGTLTPLRFQSPAARAAAGWVGVLHLDRPDVLVVLDGPAGEAWASWWAAQVDADDAAIEQVILLEAEGPGA